MFQIAALAVVAALASASDEASTVIPPAPAAVRPATPPEADPLDKIVCRPIEEINTRIPSKKECHTRREWNRMASDSQRAIDNQQMRGDTSTMPGH